MKVKLLAAVVVVAAALIASVLVARARLQSKRPSPPPHTVKLTWVGSAGARTYNVYRSQTSGVYGGPWVTGLTSPSYTDDTVSGGQTYFYAVTAVNAFGESAKSSEIKAVIPNP